MNAPAARQLTTAYFARRLARHYARRPLDLSERAAGHHHPTQPPKEQR